MATQYLGSDQSSEELDQVVAALAVGDGARVLDFACGHGELLLRLAERYRLEGVGVDLSPWQISRAAGRAEERQLRGSLKWWLGRAESMPKDRIWNVAACLGASWIWEGFEGTAAALAAYVRPRGLVTIGDLQLRSGVDLSAVDEDYGRVPTSSEQRAALEQCSIEPLAEIVASADSWSDYDRRIADSAEAYINLNPGEQAEAFRDQQQRWAEKHRDDHELLTWTVWIGRVGVK